MPALDAPRALGSSQIQDASDGGTGSVTLNPPSNYWEGGTTDTPAEVAIAFLKNESSPATSPSSPAFLINGGSGSGGADLTDLVNVASGSNHRLDVGGFVSTGSNESTSWTYERSGANNSQWGTFVVAGASGLPSGAQLTSTSGSSDTSADLGTVTAVAGGTVVIIVSIDESGSFGDSVLPPIDGTQDFTEVMSVSNIGRGLTKVFQTTTATSAGSFDCGTVTWNGTTSRNWCVAKMAFSPHANLPMYLAGVVTDVNTGLDGNTEDLVNVISGDSGVSWAFHPIDDSDLSGAALNDSIAEDFDLIVISDAASNAGLLNALAKVPTLYCEATTPTTSGAQFWSGSSTATSLSTATVENDTHPIHAALGWSDAETKTLVTSSTNFTTYDKTTHLGSGATSLLELNGDSTESVVWVYDRDDLDSNSDAILQRAAGFRVSGTNYNNLGSDGSTLIREVCRWLARAGDDHGQPDVGFEGHDWADIDSSNRTNYRVRVPRGHVNDFLVIATHSQGGGGADVDVASLSGGDLTFTQIYQREYDQGTRNVSRELYVSDGLTSPVAFDLVVDLSRSVELGSAQDATVRVFRLSGADPDGPVDLTGDVATSSESFGSSITAGSSVTAAAGNTLLCYGELRNKFASGTASVSGMTGAVEVFDDPGENTAPPNFAALYLAPGSLTATPTVTWTESWFDRDIWVVEVNADPYSSGGGTTHAGAGSSTHTLTTSASVVVDRRVAGSATGTLTSSAAAAVDRQVSGSAVGRLTLSGDATITRPASGSASGALTSSAAVVVDRQVSGSAVGTLTSSGDASVSGTLAGSGSAVGTATTTATATVTRSVTGAATGTLTTSGNALVGGVLAGAGSAVGSASTSGTATVTRAASGSAVATLSTSAAVVLDIKVAGASVAALTSSGVVSVSLAAAGSAIGALVASGAAKIPGQSPIITGVLTAVALDDGQRSATALDDGRRSATAFDDGRRAATAT